ncbi:unnamed protein product [Caenorhabditis sp. 36 PRJEB53466]|nr:unnamed protein product [Caenorhabditis sp. 36 PRJEB53466]
MSLFRTFPVLLLVTLFFLLIVLIVFDADTIPTGLSRRLRYKCSVQMPSEELEFNLNDYKVKTFRGHVSMAQLNEKVYKKFGYEIVRPTFPVPTLRMIDEPTCEMVFFEWLRISEEPQPEIPPEEIPTGRENEFLLNNYTALDKWYLNDKNSKKGEKPKNWDTLSELIRKPKEKLAGLAYGADGVSVYNAMNAHRLDGQNGVVIGSMQPWVELTALRNGASKVLTVEYNKLEIQKEFRDRMSSILPVDFVKNWQKYAGTFDFAASFSSIEHSGLGRYGDPIDPIGDLREMLKIKCLLKPGGLLFLGVPLGTDAIQFNAHRIYGSVRLAMLIYGFEWIGTFSGTNEAPYDLNSARLHEKGVFQMKQQTLVLRKL